MALFPAGKDFLEHIHDYRHDRKAFGTLGAPVRSDFPGTASPQIFRILFKKHGIQFPAEPVDIKIFQGIFLSFVKHGGQITEAGLKGGNEPHIFKGFPFQGNRIIKKLLVKINTRYPVPGEHHPIRLFRIRPACGKRGCAFQNNIIIGGSPLGRKHFLPPGIHLRIL